MRIPLALSLNSSAAEQQLPQQWLWVSHLPTKRCPCPTHWWTETQRSHDLWHLFPFSQRKSILWDGPRDFLCPAARAAAGWVTVKAAQGAEENSYELCLYLCFCWGLKWGKTREKSSHLGSLIPPFQNGSDCLWSPQSHWDKQHPCGLLLVCSGWQSSDVCLFYQQ